MTMDLRTRHAELRDYCLSLPGEETFPFGP
jgi:hypothetical protein